jgi:protoheme IX farnesyltransferase
MKSDAQLALLAPARSRTADFGMLAKPRLNLLVVASALAGYVVAGGRMADAAQVTALVVGTGLVAGGASALNQVMERRTDALMRRTRMRPLPDGRLSVLEATVFGCVLAAIGLLALWGLVGGASAAVALATCVSYVAIYTPLKRLTSFATVIGAIPGALPPVIGWTAARPDLSQGAWALFGIVFLWQLPHFLAIAWMFREDYARAGLPMLPVLEPDGRSTARQAVIYTAALVPVSLAPTLIGLTGAAYFAGALGLAGIFLVLAMKFGFSRSTRDARRLFFGSIIYLSLLWILMIADRL